MPGTRYSQSLGLWRPVAVKTFAIDGASATGIDFTDLQDYSSLRVFGDAMTHGDGGTQNLFLRLSDDTSAWTYEATGYIGTAQATTITTGIFLHSALPAATAFSFSVDLFNFNVATQKTRANVLAGREGSSTGFFAYAGRYNTARRDTALRIIAGAGVAWTAYEVHVFGIKG